MSAVEKDVTAPAPRRSVPQPAEPAVLVPPHSDFVEIQNLNLEQVRSRTKDFLFTTLPAALKTLGTVDENFDITVDTKELIEVCGTRYSMNLDGHFAKIWVGVNVKRVILILFYPQDWLTQGAAPPADRTVMLAGEAMVPEPLQFSIAGSKNVGYSVKNEPAPIDGHRVMSLWMTCWTSALFLQNPMEQAFVAQDIALFMQSVLRAAKRKKMALHVEGVDPMPL